MPDYLDLSCPDGPGPIAHPGHAGHPGAATGGAGAGRGVAPGAASGVVVYADTDDLPEDEECILVCESADANVAPLLPFVSGVIAQRGSELSHIAILAREMGIPAVVGHPAAADLAEGATVTMNGSTGEVRIVD
jgi:phosphohistidine swiveling domain-containing protein